MNNDPLHIRETTREVVKKARHVYLHETKISDAAESLRKMMITPKQSVYPVQQVFLMDCVNFCFWARKGEEKWKVEHPKGTVHDGWNALVASIDRAISENIPILDASFLTELSVPAAEYIFRSATNTSIPLLTERLNNLKEAGSILLKNYDGLFENVLKKSGYCTESLLKLIISGFPSFEDKASYYGYPVYFFKRAQITVLDLAVLSGVSMSDLEILTACADYKLPQLLRALGILEYEYKLAQTVDRMEVLKKGSPQEIEIRAATILAVEKLAGVLNISAAETDNLLWHIAARNKVGMMPYHRTRTTYY